MQATRSTFNRAGRIIQSPLVILSSVIISLCAFAIALNATQQAQRHERDTFCSTFQLIADQPLPPNVSSLGRAIASQSREVVSSKGLDCPTTTTLGRK